MKQIILIFSLLFLVSTLTAQTTFAYSYDNSGNRIQRVVVPEKNEPSDDSLAEVSLRESSSIDREEQLNNFKLYPNPTEDWVYLKAVLPIANGQLSLLDESGKTVWKGVYDGWNAQIDVSAQPSGTYVLFLEYEDKHLSWKVVKMN